VDARILPPVGLGLGPTVPVSDLGLAPVVPVGLGLAPLAMGLRRPMALSAPLILLPGNSFGRFMSARV